MIDVVFWQLNLADEQNPQSVTLHRGRKQVLEGVDYRTALVYVLLEAKGSDVYREGINPSMFVRQLRVLYLREELHVRVSDMSESAA